MSLDVYLVKVQPCDVFEANITHNLGQMASEAGIYYACWNPEKILDDPCAKDIIPFLEKGIEKMESDPEYFRRFDAENGFGTYDDFLSWLKRYLDACRQYPDATIRVSR